MENAIYFLFPLEKIIVIIIIPKIIYRDQTWFGFFVNEQFHSIESLRCRLNIHSIYPNSDGNIQMSLK